MNKCDDFETLGYIEQLQENEHPFRVLGDRRVETPNRILGIQGQILLTITENLVLTKGHREVTLKASPKRPRVVRATLQRLCGRIIKK